MTSERSVHLRKRYGALAGERNAVTPRRTMRFSPAAAQPSSWPGLLGRHPAPVRYEPTEAIMTSQRIVVTGAKDGKSVVVSDGPGDRDRYPADARLGLRAG